MAGWRAGLVVAGSLVGCTGTSVTAPPVFCDGATAHRWAPRDDTDLTAFPDDALTVDDPTSPTGLRVDLAPGRTAWIDALPSVLHGMVAGLEVLSGFARNGAVVLRFDGDVGALPADAEASVTSDTLQLLDLSTSPPTRVPYEATVGDDGRQVILQPLRALAPGARHAVVLTTAHTAADGACIAPGPALRAVLTDTASDARLQRLVPRYAELLAATGLLADDVSAAVVFTTHDDLGPIRDAVDAIAAQTVSWSGPADCRDTTALRVCTRPFEASDYRGPEGFVDDGTPHARWELTAHYWKPLAASGALPTLVFGHGLASSAGEGGTAASMLADDGIGVISLAALQHGDHPTDTNPDASALAFLGLDLTAGAIDGLALRGNFTQTLLDRAQLVQLLRDDPDVDGDGQPDVDDTQLAYLGISLGGLLGPGLLAARDDLQAAVLEVAGGNLIKFVTDTGYVALIRPLFVSQLGSEAAFDRLLAVAQAVVDPADPATFAAHVLRDRFHADTAPPHVLLPVAQFDDTVPPATGMALARAFQLPQVPPVAWEVPPLATAAAPPLSANVDGLTLGYFQFDRVTDDGVVTRAEHPNTPWSPEGRAQMLAFYRAWRDTGTPEIIDPFALLGTPPAP